MRNCGSASRAEDQEVGSSPTVYPNPFLLINLPTLLQFVALGRFLGSLESIGYALFCITGLQKPFEISQIRTLCKKMGCTYPPACSFEEWLPLHNCTISVHAKPFRISTYASSRKCSLCRTCRKAKSFRIRTYKKQGGGPFPATGPSRIANLQIT